ncbi:carboxy terminal-processing peptidase [Chitinophaga sp. GCM10012297]|uniref:Carboxy terminal-processing peptidase n=1 Tax=Chitinophaga chungangae TaxID=2821488 RepID=A0ABS3Y8Y4_9BACT|nr:carboxy terminal-processing peptidase [Chitinophaga chungangae]MBO9151143.1 carboxy terminal-processing peptidase [Chitinophaga chungangae]
MKMKLKVIVPVMLIVLTAGIFAFTKIAAKGDPPTRYQAIIALVGQILKEGHYQPKEIDDAFSREVFAKYLKNLDGEKKFFLKNDIQTLKPLEMHVDEELNGAPLDFFNRTNEIIKKRIAEVAVLYPEILAKPFDFTKKETVVIDPESADWPATDAERKEAWRKSLKYRALEKYAELTDQRDKDKTGKTDAELEVEARARVKKIYDRYFDRLKNRTSEDDRFSLYVNSITTTMDPHTDYFPPVEKRSFQESMAGKFYGIGAQLREDEGRIKIVSIVPGSPSWKDGKLKADDVILKVGEGSKEAVDISGYAVDEAVTLIRGSKGTEVKLTVKSGDGTIKEVSLIRDEIKIDDTFAKSAIINGAHKIGYIYLPEFYADFTDRDGAFSYDDVAAEIKKLKDEKVEGIILDLRFNGGGSLPDVIKMAGLFVPEGTMVQVRSRGGEIQQQRDRDKSVQYEGPLAIMVNEYSASASEIMAAAMQDYKRAVVIGSQSSFGKGTVQRLLELDNFVRGDLGGSLGAIKLTVQKFYRANGGSTQLKGVESDVVLPSPYYEVGEKRDKDALKWDVIPKANYETWRDPVDVEPLKRNSAQRVANNEAFKMINENIATLKKLDEQKTYPLDITSYKTDVKKSAAASKRYDAVNEKVTPLNITSLKVDMAKIQNDTIKVARNKDWIKARYKDPYLSEAVNVMNDLIMQTAYPKLKNNYTDAKVPANK